METKTVTFLKDDGGFRYVLGTALISRPARALAPAKVVTFDERGRKETTIGERAKAALAEWERKMRSLGGAQVGA